VAGGAVVGVGTALVGAAVVGATVLDRMVNEGDDVRDALVLADGDGLAAIAGAKVPRPKNARPITSTVARLPATAARPRSTHRGPRRGGGITFVVSLVTNSACASGMPLARSVSAAPLSTVVVAATILPRRRGRPRRRGGAR
jgi:hypothetical protein